MSGHGEVPQVPFDWENMPPISEPAPAAEPAATEDPLAGLLERRRIDADQILEPYPDPVEPEREPSDAAERLVLFSLGGIMAYCGFRVGDLTALQEGSELLIKARELTVDASSLTLIALGTATMAVTIFGKKSDADAHDELPSAKHND